jgi:hypothetical protein
MVEHKDQGAVAGSDEQVERRVSPPADDARRPYEAPRLLKKRSVARATLFTVAGTMTTGLVVSG